MRLKDARGAIFHGLIALALCALTITSGAKWMAPTQMPVARLLKTAADFTRAHPRDAQGYYMLGRINSAAFAQDTETLGMFPGDPLPTLPAYAESPVQPRASTKPISKSALKYYGDAVRNYRKAVELDSKSAIAWLGAGFELEEGIRSPLTMQIAREILTIRGTPGTDTLRAESLRCYRRAYALAAGPDAGATRGGFGKPISQEAAECIVRLQKGRKLMESELRETARLEDTIKKLSARPRPITPILISFGGKSRLSDLLSPGATVRFDLSGEASNHAWPWVKPDTGILVWDPRHTGRINSGLQLFGSVTWWLFWKDGYAPLAALDDDRSGRLEGAELRGIAVWFDRNGNGISDAGEVVSLEALGVQSIAVHAAGKQSGTLWNSEGIVLRNGRMAATFDWTPTSIRDQ